jgi:hypothetical protein
MSPRATTSLLALLTLAAVALAGPPDGAAELKKAWTRAQDPAARQAALRRAGEAPSVDVARALARIVLDAQVEWPTREVAVQTLAAIASPDVVAWAGEAVAGGERDPLLRAVLCDYLGARATHDPKLGPLLLPALQDDRPQVVLSAIRGLARVRLPETVDALVALTEREGIDARVLGDAMRALRALTGERFASAAEWRSWWTTAREGFAVPTPEEVERRSADAPGGGELRTITRVPPTSEAGPSLYGAIESSAVLFVVDVSYSMHVRVWAEEQGATNPTRLDYVKEALVQAVESLPETTTFNIISFSTAPTPWKRKLVEASAATKREATRWVRALRNDGDTNISDSLELAFQHPDVDTIYFLTDGTPTHGRLLVPDEILGAVRGWNAGRNVRVNAIAFLAGDGARFNVVENKGMAERLMRALAEQTGGTFTLVD